MDGEEEEEADELTSGGGKKCRGDIDMVRKMEEAKRVLWDEEDEDLTLRGRSREGVGGDIVK